MRAVESGLQEPCNLLTDQYLKRAFGHEQAGIQRVRVLDRRLNVLVGQVFERVDAVDHFVEYLVEDVIDP